MQTWRACTNAWIQAAKVPFHRLNAHMNACLCVALQTDIDMHACICMSSCLQHLVTARGTTLPSAAYIHTCIQTPMSTNAEIHATKGTSHLAFACLCTYECMCECMHARASIYKIVARIASCTLQGSLSHCPPR